MIHSRRAFLATAATATFAAIPLPANAAETHDEDDEQSTGGSIAEEILRRFDSLPGDKSIKIFAPAAEGKRRLLIESGASKVLFAASSIKTFVLCEALRQADASDVIETIEAKELVLNDTVWSFGSPTFNQPDLSGIVSERTTLEAMITRSDNTATDMVLKLVGADRVRAFIAGAGLTRTLIPDSTRALTAYLFGAENYLTITWDELQQVVKGSFVHPFLNDVETFASSADDLVSYYSRALQGEFFKHPETLTEFRRILTLCDYIYLIPLPLGVSAYAKSGNADSPDFHARAFAGGMFVSGRWVYFAFLINWYAAEQEDPKTVKRYFSAINYALTRVRDRFAM